MREEIRENQTRGFARGFWFTTHKGTNFSRSKKLCSTIRKPPFVGSEASDRLEENVLLALRGSSSEVALGFWFCRPKYGIVDLYGGLQRNKHESSCETSSSFEGEGNFG